MKFLSSLFLLSSIAYAQMVQIHSVHIQNARWVKEIFVEKYFIPEDLIEINLISGCSEVIKNKKKLEICLSESGEMIFLATPKNVIQTLNTFKL